MSKKATTKKAAPKGLTLYDIDDRLAEILETHMDPRTGEIGEEAVAELEELDMKREDKLIGYVYVIKNHEAMADAANTEIERLKGRAKAITNYIGFLTARIKEAVPVGTEISSGTRRIWYRRTTATKFKDDVAIEDIPHAYCKHKPEEWTPMVGLARDGLAAKEPEAIACAETVRGWSLQID